MQIPDDIRADLDFLIAPRRDLHARPELGFEEERTSAIVARILGEAPFAFIAGSGGTDVVGTLKVGEGARSIGLRAT